MNFLGLSISGMVMLVTTVGLSSSNRALGLSLGPSFGLSSEGLSEHSLGHSLGHPPENFSAPSARALLASKAAAVSSSQTTHSTTTGSQPNRSSQPYRLTVETSGRSLNAELRIDGRIIKTLTSASETIELSAYLSTAGQHTIEILGTYMPATATAEILLVGPGTQISQQVSGQGTLRQTLGIVVR